MPVYCIFGEPTFQEKLNYIHHGKRWKADIVIVEPGKSNESTPALSPEWATNFDALLLDDATLHLDTLHCCMVINQMVKGIH